MPPSKGKNPKACQECRQRKVRCTGGFPCVACKNRDTPCTYRTKTRDYHKRRPPRSKAKSPEERSTVDSFQEQHDAPYTRPAVNVNGHVSAIHNPSPSCTIELYYGASSSFSLMQQTYNDLCSSSSAQGVPSGDVEEASGGLNLFNFHRIFFGNSLNCEGGQKSAICTPNPLLILPFDVAQQSIGQFFCTFHPVLPFKSRAWLEVKLEEMYKPISALDPEPWSRYILLLAIAIGALTTEHHAWGDALYDHVRTLSAAATEVVNLSAVQVSLLMISHGFYQTEQGHPNSSFLHLGTALRKAISAGLHKDPPNVSRYSVEEVRERRDTFWSLYYCESWVSFALGRASLLSRETISIPTPDDPFLFALTELATLIVEASTEIYTRSHTSLFSMWEKAKSIHGKLDIFDQLIQRSLGFRVQLPTQNQEQGVQKFIMVTLYNHFVLLLFRPFLIFRGRLRKENKSTGHLSHQRNIPQWVNEGCDCALDAARKNIYHMHESSRSNVITKDIRYKCYFLEGASFVYVFDLLHNSNASTSHLPWIHSGLDCLSMMRRGEPAESTMSAIQTALKTINADYEWIPGVQDHSVSIPWGQLGTSDMPSFGLGSLDIGEEVPGEVSALQALSSACEVARQDNSEGAFSHSGDLLDFTADQLGWDFDFSTMDLESFLSLPLPGS